MPDEVEVIVNSRRLTAAMTLYLPGMRHHLPINKTRETMPRTMIIEKATP